MTSTVFYYWFSLGWLIIAACIFMVLMFVTAPYGKFTRTGWGPLVNGTLGWVIMEAPAALLMVFFFVLSGSYSNPVAIVFLILWELHYAYRAFIYPFRLRGEKRHMTSLTVVFGVIFNCGNGYLNGFYLFSLATPYVTDWFHDPRFIIGLSVFLVGMVINHQSDSILRSLRKPGETGYKIPKGGMFNHVSSANYFGEPLEWTGFAVLTWSPGALVFLIWTAANLIPRARSQHAWYQKTFPNYPKNRKAIFPYIF
jgi:3-oxo-5-alpha-steroid 4-dehydrogenase 1